MIENREYEFKMTEEELCQILSEQMITSGNVPTPPVDSKTNDSFYYDQKNDVYLFTMRNTKGELPDEQHN